MTVDEQLTGWYTLTRQARRPEEIARAYAHLGEAVVRLGHWRILPYTESAIARVAGLKALRLNVRLMDCASPPSRRRIRLWSSPATGVTSAASPA